jgi:glycosyltransferase involved in cell wall biosynthesis
MVKKYQHEVVVLSRSLTGRESSHNGVIYRRCGATAVDFLSQVNNEKPDHLFIYSDCFNFWPTVLEKSREIKAKKSIALVGMNTMLQKRPLLSLFRARKQEFTVITHSDCYVDYKTCVEADIPATVIPNGIDLNEFNPSAPEFRKKYGIETSKIILCVSNFFPAKGQEFMPKILNDLYDKFQDFTAVFMCSNVNFFIANHLREKFRLALRNAKFKSRLLIDCPRSDVVRAFMESDVFAFPSQIEVAPLVLLESMAARLPWVGLPVGNTMSLAGGKLVPSIGRNSKGELLYGPSTYELFTKNLFDILTDQKIHDSLANDGRSLVEKKYNWDVIADQYQRAFAHTL